MWCLALPLHCTPAGVLWCHSMAGHGPPLPTSKAEAFCRVDGMSPVNKRPRRHIQGKACRQIISLPLTTESGQFWH